MSGLEIIAPDPRRHAAAVIDLVSKCFGNYFAFRDHCRRGYLLGSHYDWGASRVGLLGGRLVTHWGVWDYAMRIGSAAVRAGGIGVVATQADHRKRGYMARTARASLAAMRGAGYDVSILFGISDFYHRFGYVPAWAEVSWTMKAADLPAAPLGARLLRTAARHRRDLAAIYNREHAGLTGTAVRPTFRACARTNRWEGHRWTDGRGRTAGYVFLTRDPDRIVCQEAGGDPEQVLRALRAVARRRGAREVRFDVPHDASRLARRLRQANARAEYRYNPAGGAMVRLVNLRGTLDKMAGELSRRLAASAMRDWRGTLVVAGAGEEAALHIRRGRVRVGPGRSARHAIWGGAALARLLIGSAEPDEAIEAGRMRLSGDARRLAAVLFPNQHPMLSAWDRF